MGRLRMKGFMALKGENDASKESRKEGRQEEDCC